MIIKKIYKELIVINHIEDEELPPVIDKLCDIFNDAVTVEYHKQDEDFWVSVERFYCDTDWRSDIRNSDDIEEVLSEWN